MKKIIIRIDFIIIPNKTVYTGVARTLFWNKSMRCAILHMKTSNGVNGRGNSVKRSAWNHRKNPGIALI